MAYLLDLLKRALQALDALLITSFLTAAIITFGFLVYPGWLGEAKEAGASAERLKWVAAKEEADAKRDAAISAAQRKIDDAESKMVLAQASNDLKINDLNAALAAERADNAKVESAGDGVPVCKPRPMPERVRNALNAFRGQ